MANFFSTILVVPDKRFTFSKSQNWSNINNIFILFFQFIESCQFNTIHRVTHNIIQYSEKRKVWTNQNFKEWLPSSTGSLEERSRVFQPKKCILTCSISRLVWDLVFTWKLIRKEMVLQLFGYLLSMYNRFLFSKACIMEVQRGILTYADSMNSLKN
jgi:hypothetical protein